jgi:hypothetical protein
MLKPEGVEWRIKKVRFAFWEKGKGWMGYQNEKEV